MTTKKTEKNNVLIGDSDEKANEMDNALIRLTKIAIPKPTYTNRKYKSRFFFEVYPTNSIDIESIKNSHNKKPLIPVNAEVEILKQGYESELSSPLNENLKVIREFFLKELAPKTFATNGGLNQVLEIVGNVVGEIDQSSLNCFNRIAHQAVMIRLCRFAATYFDLSYEDAERLIDIMTQKNIMPIPIPLMENNNGKQKKDGTAKS